MEEIDAFIPFLNRELFTSNNFKLNWRKFEKWFRKHWNFDHLMKLTFVYVKFQFWATFKEAKSNFHQMVLKLGLSQRYLIVPAWKVVASYSSLEKVIKLLGSLFQTSLVLNFAVSVISWTNLAKNMVDNPTVLSSLQHFKETVFLSEEDNIIFKGIISKHHVCIVKLLRDFSFQWQILLIVLQWTRDTLVVWSMVPLEILINLILGVNHWFIVPHPIT